MYKGLHNTIANGRNQIVQYFHIPKPRLKDIRLSQFLVILGSYSSPILTLIFQIFLKHLIYYYLYINLLTFKKNASKKKHLPIGQLAYWLFYRGFRVPSPYILVVSVTIDKLYLICSQNML